MKVMMVTTEADNSFICQALEYGADEFLMKPFTPESLREKLDDWAGGINEGSIVARREGCCNAHGNQRPIRVLAVDDSAVMRGILRTLFQTQGRSMRAIFRRWSCAAWWRTA
jgi:CheY-like chemotaxis protein